jgi:hypothetical protein
MANPIGQLIWMEAAYSGAGEFVSREYFLRVYEATGFTTSDPQEVDLDCRVWIWRAARTAKSRMEQAQ